MGNFNDWLVVNLKNRGDDMNWIPNFLVFASTLWLLWIWRCSTAFDINDVMPSLPLLVVCRFCLDWLQAISDAKKVSSVRTQLLACNTPSEGWIKLNGGGGMRRDLGIISSGGVVRGSDKC
ncbi:hypothetical protein ACOSQ3_028547 [Xanthoceras sorbifolium]